MQCQCVPFSSARSLLHLSCHLCFHIQQRSRHCCLPASMHARSSISIFFIIVSCYKIMQCVPQIRASTPARCASQIARINEATRTPTAGADEGVPSHDTSCTVSSPVNVSWRMEVPTACNWLSEVSASQSPTSVSASVSMGMSPTPASHHACTRHNNALPSHPPSNDAPFPHLSLISCAEARQIILNPACPARPRL